MIAQFFVYLFVMIDKIKILNLKPPFKASYAYIDLFSRPLNIASPIELDEVIFELSTEYLIIFANGIGFESLPPYTDPPPPPKIMDFC